MIISCTKKCIEEITDATFNEINTRNEEYSKLPDKYLFIKATIQEKPSRRMAFSIYNYLQIPTN